MLLDENGQAFFITKPVNDSYLENYKDRLKNDLFTATMTPDITDEKFSSNASGVALRYKLWGLEQIVSTCERKFQKSLMRRFKLIVTYLNNKGANYDYKEIEPHFTRNIPVHVKDEAETLKLLRGNVSDETAYSQMSFILDPLYEKQKFEEQQLEKMESYDLGGDDADDIETDNESGIEASTNDTESDNL